jgi:hypothetical protein
MPIARTERCRRLSAGEALAVGQAIIKAIPARDQPLWAAGVFAVSDDPPLWSDGHTVAERLRRLVKLSPDPAFETLPWEAWVAPRTPQTPDSRGV